MSIANESPENQQEDYSLSAVQHRLCSYIRSPNGSNPPEGLDLRRLNVYRELVFNNIESLLSGTFPVLKSILGERWNEQVTDFLSAYRAQTPYFTRLANEFYRFIQHRQSEGTVPLYVEELAHHELLELELLYRQADGYVQPCTPVSEPGLALSPLAEITRYRYPVHRLSALYLPELPPEDPTYMLQFRNRVGKVVFMQLSAVAFQLLTLISLHPGQPGDRWLEGLAGSRPKPASHHNMQRFNESGQALLDQLLDKGVLYLTAQSTTTR